MRRAAAVLAALAAAGCEPSSADILSLLPASFAGATVAEVRSETMGGCLLAALDIGALPDPVPDPRPPDGPDPRSGREVAGFAPTPIPWGGYREMGIKDSTITGGEGCGGGLSALLQTRLKEAMRSPGGAYAFFRHDEALLVVTTDRRLAFLMVWDS